jgi:CRP/FNR family cyclic AMP-dependent transcriptional regulator
VEIMSSSRPGWSVLGADFLRDLRAIRPVQRFPIGAPLYQRGSPGNGVYVVEAGEVQVILEAGKGERQLLELAGPGAILGLSESMAAVKYRATVLAAEETKAVFIPREEFLAFLHEQLRLLFAGGTPVE